MSRYDDPDFDAPEGPGCIGVLLILALAGAALFIYRLSQ